MKDSDIDSLGTHLEGIHGALRSLARHLSRADGNAAVRSQLEWAASHLNLAIRELSGEGPGSDELEDAQSAPPIDGGMMDGLRGTTRSITLSEILGFIATLRKTGVLRVSTDAESFLVQLEDGHVVYAQADAPPPGQRLGEILVARGSLTQAELDQALHEHSGAEDVLGRRLLNEGLLSQADLKLALAFQIQCIFHRLFEATGALFQFDEGVTAIRTDDVRLNVTSLLLESARSSDELARDPRHAHA